MEKTGPSSENLQTQSLDSELGDNGPKFGESPNSPRVWRKQARVRRISKLTPSLEKTGLSSENLQTQARFLQTPFVKHAKKRSASVLVEKISVRMEMFRQNKRSAGETHIEIWSLENLQTQPEVGENLPEFGESPNSGPFSPNSGPSLENLQTEFGESPNAGLSLEKICPRLGNFQTHPEFGENGPEFGESPNSSPFSPNSGPSLPKFDTRFEFGESPTSGP